MTMYYVDMAFLESYHSSLLGEVSQCLMELYLNLSKGKMDRGLSGVIPQLTIG